MHDTPLAETGTACGVAASEKGDCGTSSTVRANEFQGRAELEPCGDGFLIDATLLGELLELAPSNIQRLMQREEITSLSEQGVGEHAGQHRLTFFHEGRRARLYIDGSGKIIRRSIVDFGKQPLPPKFRMPQGL